MAKVSPQTAFLVAFAQSGSVTKAARSARVSRQMHYRWLEAPEYSQAFQKAGDQAAKKLSEMALTNLRQARYDRPRRRPRAMAAGLVG